VRQISPSGKVIALLSLIIILLFFYGVNSVPFHPDESSLLYQSQDLEKLFTNPSSLVWDSDRTGELDQTYRLLNPPIPKYIVGLGRILAGYDSESVSVDWNWSTSWEENVASSALPDPNLLLGSRITTTAALLCSLIPLILIARRLSGNSLAIITILIFGIYSIILLHGRRAMSEGPLIFGTSLAILGILEAEKHPWLTGLGTALAASSKLSAAALLPVGLIAILWRRKNSKPSNRVRLRDLMIFSLVVIIVTLILNPVLWSNPLAGIGHIWNSRVDFSIRQTETIRAVSPEQVLETPIQRIIGMMVMMFFRGPQTSEVANYIEQTRSDEESYLSNPFNTVISGSISGGIAFLVTSFGVGFSVFQLKGAAWKKQREIILLLIGTAGQAAAILLANSIPFQRYYVPLVPFTILWMSLGFLNFPRVIKKAAQYMDGLVNKSPSPYSRK
jgi:4-amino-4-deoxy-L-arabinose transferase-like glycosyltransferase